MSLRFLTILPTLLLMSFGVFFAAGPAEAAGLFARAQDFPTETQPEAVAIADFNGDGNKDLAVTNLNAEEFLTVSILMGNGDGTFDEPVNYDLPDAEFQIPTAIITADLDGDGDPDIATTATGNSDTLVVLRNNGDGTFGSLVSYQPVLSQDYPLAVTAADFNEDGATDLAVAFLLRNSAAGNISVFPGNGDGTFRTPVPFDTGTDEPTSLTSADLNGDGRADLAATSQGDDGDGPSDVSVLIGNGDLTFQSAVTYPVGTSPQFVIASDLDGDGRPDLATANYAANNVSVLIGNGDGTFGNATDYGAGMGSAPYGVASGDFDGDDKTDLVTANSGTNGISVLPGEGDGTFGTPEPYAAGSGTAFVGVSDFNEDEKPDVVAANASSNDVSILLNAAPPEITSVEPASGYRGSTITLTIDGSAFGDGARVGLSKELLGLKASSVERDSQTRLTAEVPVPKFAPAGLYDVEVTNPDKQDDTLSQSLRILAPLKTDLTLNANPGALQPGRSTRLSGKLATSRGNPLPGEELILEQRPAGTDGPFRELATLTTKPDGTFRLSGAEPSKDTVYRARFAGDPADGLQASRASTLVKVGS